MNSIQTKLPTASEQWIDDSMISSTSIPSEPLPHDYGTVWGLIMIVFGALAIIVIMFLIAIFIDCRQQKLVEMQQAHKPKHFTRKRKLRLPKLGTTVEEDHESFASKMQDSAHSEPPV